MFRNNKIAEFKEDYNYLVVDKKHRETVDKVIKTGKFKSDILEGSNKLYIGEKQSSHLQYIKTILKIYEVKSEFVKASEDYLCEDLLKKGMD